MLCLVILIHTTTFQSGCCLSPITSYYISSAPSDASIHPSSPSAYWSLAAIHPSVTKAKQSRDVGQLELQDHLSVWPPGEVALSVGVLADHSSQRYRSQCSLSVRTNPATMCYGSYRCANASEVLGFRMPQIKERRKKGQITLYWSLGFLILAKLLKIEMFRVTRHTYLR